MLTRDFPSRVARLAVILSVSLFALCIAAAFYFYRQQAATAESLGENIGSRKAARNVEIALEDLIQHLGAGSDQAGVFAAKVKHELAEARRLADKDEEERLVRELEASYDRSWQELQDGSGAATTQHALKVLVADTLPISRRLQKFNAEQIDLSEAEHRETVRRMAIGLAIVGTVGSLVGVFLGYNVARSLRRSLYQISVCVRDAAGKLGQDLPTVNLSGTGDLGDLREQMQGVVHDIEQMVEKLQQREHEVLRAEHLSAVGQLAAGAAHELRNPLTSIKMLVQANRHKAETRGMPGEHLAIIEQEIRRMERCLQRFIDFARPPRPECRPITLAPLVDRAFALLEPRAAKQKVNLKFKSWPTPLGTNADEEQIYQLLINLCLNALDAMPHGGTLEVALAPDPGGQIEIKVFDTGAGMPAELLPRLFEPFVSTKETGLGLGLVVSKRIAENHHGTLDGANRAEGGACFTLRLPTCVPPTRECPTVLEHV